MKSDESVIFKIFEFLEKVCPETELVYSFVEDGATALAYKRVDAKIGWPQKLS